MKERPKGGEKRVMKKLISLISICLIVLSLFLVLAPQGRAQLLWRVLVDASKDGGVWWYPQEGSFDPNLPHQGKALADYLRSNWFTVTELAPGVTIDLDLLNEYDMVIAVDCASPYSESETNAYLQYVSEGGALLLLSEHHGDTLSPAFGLDFQGLSIGSNIVNSLVDHPITEGVTSFNYPVGSGLISYPPALRVVGWLSEDTFLDLNDNGVRDASEPYGAPVLGYMHYSNGRIAFLGDTNCLQLVPQPLTGNIITWLLAPLPRVHVYLGIIPVDTADEGIVHSESYFTEIGEKLEEYFTEVSYEGLVVHVEVHHNPDGSWFSLPEESTWYSSREIGVFLEAAIDSCDDIVDFTLYDYTGMAGIVAFVPPSDIRGGGAFIRSSRSTSGYYDTDDGTTIDVIYVPEERFRGTGQVIRGLAHEFAHALGKLGVTTNIGNSKDCSWVLPDLYLRGNVDQRWALMGQLLDRDLERIHLCSYSKEWLGWLEYKETEIGETHTLRPLATLGYEADVLTYRYDDDFYIMELRTNSTDESEWDTETRNEKVVAFYQVDVRSDDPTCQPDQVNLVHTQTEVGTFQDPDVGVTFNVLSLTEEAAEVSIQRYGLKRFVGSILLVSADVWIEILPFLPHEALELLPLPDIDLHAYSEDGKHVGLNYETGEYEIEVSGAIASGDLLNGREWIFVPEDSNVHFVVSSHDIEEFLDAFPEAGELTDGIETYTTSITYYDPEENRYESMPLSQEIMSGEEIMHRCAVIQNPDGTYTPVIDDISPSLTVEVPQENAALQDGVTFTASAWDENGVSSVTFSIREPNGEQGTVISPEFEFMPASPSTDDKWELIFDTTMLPDGYYLTYVEATDTAGNVASDAVPFSIRNWACIELLPASESNKAGRTMPVKFSLRVAEGVDPAQPFVYNEELTILIYEEGHSESILQESIYGDVARDYRIDSMDELYITNFQTIRRKLTTYVVEIYRKDMLIGWFTFEALK